MPKIHISMPTPDICWMTFEYVSIYVIIDFLRIEDTAVMQTR